LILTFPLAVRSGTGRLRRGRGRSVVAGRALAAPFLLGEVAGGGFEFASPDSFILDVPADGFPAEVGLSDQGVLSHAEFVGFVERGGEAKGPLFTRFGLCVGNRFKKLGHRLLPTHMVMVPHECGHAHSSIPASLVGRFAVATILWQDCSARHGRAMPGVAGTG